MHDDRRGGELAGCPLRPRPRPGCAAADATAGRGPPAGGYRTGLTRKQNGLGLTLAVVGGCLALLLVVLALVTRDDASDDSAAIGFPVVIVGLIVVATLFALGWRALSKRSHSDR